jgi:hypothetical protein
MRTTAMVARFVAFLPSTEDVRYACRAAAIVQGQPLADEGRRLLDRLTPKQAEVFWLLVAGHDAQAIAYRLGKSYTAVNERLVIRCVLSCVDETWDKGIFDNSVRSVVVVYVRGTDVEGFRNPFRACIVSCTCRLDELYRESPRRQPGRPLHCVVCFGILWFGDVCL